MTRLRAIRSTPIAVDECVSAVAHPSAGGTAVFLGTVRDENDAQPVTLLEYEAYVAMAEKEMDRICDELEREVVGVRLAVLHRIGALQIGDIAVVCAASAPHRAEAFLACRLLIDRVKARVPIWKREHGPAGAQWVEPAQASKLRQ